MKPIRSNLGLSGRCHSAGDSRFCPVAMLRGPPAKKRKREAKSHTTLCIDGCIVVAVAAIVGPLTLKLTPSLCVDSGGHHRLVELTAKHSWLEQETGRKDVNHANERKSSEEYVKRLEGEVSELRQRVRETEELVEKVRREASDHAAAKVREPSLFLDWNGSSAMTRDE